MSDYLPNGAQGAFYDLDENFDVWRWIDETLQRLGQPDDEAGQSSKRKLPLEPTLQSGRFPPAESHVTGITYHRSSQSLHRASGVPLDSMSCLEPEPFEIGLNQGSYVCAVPACARDFRRQYELQCHVRSCHEDRRPFTCTGLECSKGKNNTVAPAFKRLDKLTAHIKTVHRPTTLFRCPVPECPFREYVRLEVLAVHVRLHHQGLVGESEEKARAVGNASPRGYAKCPVWQCRKFVLLGSYLDHLAEHMYEELASETETLDSQGYVLEHSGHSRTAEQIQSCPVLKIVCPMCTRPCLTHEEFAIHFWNEHLFASEDAAIHFRQWQAALGKSRIYGRTKVLPWPLVTVHSSRAEMCGRFTCPTCKKDRPVDHHPGLLRPDQNFAPVSMQIIQLYPEFESNPDVKIFLAGLAS